MPGRLEGLFLFCFGFVFDDRVHIDVGSEIRGMFHRGSQIVDIHDVLVDLGEPVSPGDLAPLPELRIPVEDLLVAGLVITPGDRRDTLGEEGELVRVEGAWLFRGLGAIFRRLDILAGTP